VELRGKITADRCTIHCQGAHLIINRLNGLPLALTQAGSYLRQTNMAASTYVKYYDSTWRDLMKKHDRFPLQEYGDRSVLTTWKMSYKQVQSQSEEAAGLLRLWGFLDRGDLWYELVACVSRLDESIKKPDWLLRLAENELEFLSSLQLLSHYSPIDAKEDALSYSMYAVLYGWCCHLAEGSERSMLSGFAASIVAYMTPGESEPECWKLRKRLLPHGSRVQRWMDERLEQPDRANDWVAQPWIQNHLGVLFACQGKLVEAEKMYMRALQGYEKTLGAEHISTLDTVNNLGILYEDQGKLVEAEEMYMRALQGYEKTLGAENVATYRPALNTAKNLGKLYRDQAKLAEAESMFSRALIGFQTILGPSHEECQHLSSAITSLSHFERYGR
jgi:tetratricopeptide (TPR) repeat protein